MNKIAHAVSNTYGTKIKLSGATIPDWDYIKGNGFQCFDDYVILYQGFDSLLTLVIKLNELGV